MPKVKFLAKHIFKGVIYEAGLTYDVEDSVLKEIGSQQVEKIVSTPVKVKDAQGNESTQMLGVRKMQKVEVSDQFVASSEKAAEPEKKEKK